MSSSGKESVYELGIEVSEANNVLLMSLMEEIHEDEYYGDDRLVSMIQSLEAEINDPQMYKDNQDCSTSIIGQDFFVDMELISSSQFDEMINAWIPCEDNEMEHVAMENEAENMIDDFDQMCYGVFLGEQQRETYFPQGISDAVF